MVRSHAGEDTRVIVTKRVQVADTTPTTDPTRASCPQMTLNKTGSYHFLWHFVRMVVNSDSLDIHHEIMRLISGNKLYQVPLENPQRILDLGTGTGRNSRSGAITVDIDKDQESGQLTAPISILRPWLLELT